MYNPYADQILCHTRASCRVAKVCSGSFSKNSAVSFSAPFLAGQKSHMGFIHVYNMAI